MSRNSLSQSEVASEFALAAGAARLMEGLPRDGGRRRTFHLLRPQGRKCMRMGSECLQI